MEGWLVRYRDGLPAHRRSPIQVLTGPVSINYVDQNQRINHYTKLPATQANQHGRQIYVYAHTTHHQ